MYATLAVAQSSIWTPGLDTKAGGLYVYTNNLIHYPSQSPGGSMSQKQGSQKKKRKPKKSQGINGGGGKVNLTYLQKALISSNFITKKAKKLDADNKKKGA